MCSVLSASCVSSQHQCECVLLTSTKCYILLVDAKMVEMESSKDEDHFSRQVVVDVVVNYFERFKG